MSLFYVLLIVNCYLNGTEIDGGSIAGELKIMEKKRSESERFTDRDSHVINCVDPSLTLGC